MVRSRSKYLECILWSRVLHYFFVATLCIPAAKERSLKAGDIVYACNRGEGCGCNTLSSGPGKCACGSNLVRAKVTASARG
jgi:hypothetical protein